MKPRPNKFILALFCVLVIGLLGLTVTEVQHQQTDQEHANFTPPFYGVGGLPGASGCDTCGGGIGSNHNNGTNAPYNGDLWHNYGVPYETGTWTWKSSSGGGGTWVWVCSKNCTNTPPSSEQTTGGGGNGGSGQNGSNGNTDQNSITETLVTIPGQILKKIKSASKQLSQALTGLAKKQNTTTTKESIQIDNNTSNYTVTTTKNSNGTTTTTYHCTGGACSGNGDITCKGGTCESPNYSGPTVQSVISQQENRTTNTNPNTNLNPAASYHRAH